MKSTQARHARVAQLVSLEITDSTYEDKLYLIDRFAGAGRYNAQKNWAALSCRPLRGANLMCSSTLSVNCEQVAKDTQRYPDCRSPISQRSHVGNLRQTLQGKRGDLQEGGKPQVVYPLVRPRGVSALPAARRGKSPLNFSEKLTNPEYSSSRSAFCGSSLCGRGSRSPAARWSAWR
jgi:hypothetical protein